MLVVLAITAVLLSIIIVPMIQSFNFTRAAESLAQEQEKGRELIDQISRDIASGTAVGDNEGINGETVIQVPYTDPTTHVTTTYDMPIYSSRIDIYKPARTSLVANAADGSFYNNVTGHYDPTLQSNNGQPIVPATQGGTIVRYFIGLRQPLVASTSGGTTTYTAGAYSNPFEGLLTPISDQRENLFVLYRVEFNPNLMLKDPGGVTRYAFFKNDPKNPNSPYIDDPYFFTLSTPALDTNLAANGGAADQAWRIRNLQNQQYASLTVVTDDTRSDMIMPVYNLATRVVSTYNTTYLGAAAVLPKIQSLIQFRPSPVAQESATGETAVAFGNESTSSSKVFTGSDNNPYVNPELGIASDVLRTTMGAWNSAVVTIFPFPVLSQVVPYTPSVSPSANDYLVMDLRSGALPFGTAGTNSTSPTTAFPDIWPTTQQNMLLFTGVVNTPVTTGQILPMFDLNQYAISTAANTAASARYPFSEGIAAAEAEDPSGDDWLTLSQAVRDEFIPFDYDSHSGQVESSFSISEFGNPAATTKNIDNSPMPLTCGNASTPSAAPLTPAADTASQGTGINFYDPQFASINERYNAAYNQNPLLRPVLQRFVDLRVQPEGDEWCSPMDPDPADAAPVAFALNEFPCGSPPPTPANPPTFTTTKTPWVTGWKGFDNVTIVPSSEVVEGPDQTNTNGQMIRYTRVTANPGPNQYVINYSNLAEPTDYTQLGGATQAPGTSATTDYDFTKKAYPNTGYDPHNVLSVMIQPRFKVGYIQFDSDPNVPLPSGYFHITYRMQFNRPADSVAVNYDSREVLNVLLTMRNYPQASNIPNAQTITLQASAPVKNFLR
jgi:hypothetical protein